MLGTILKILTIANISLGAIFILCYFYQFVFAFIAFAKKNKAAPDAPPHKFAILIAARNEEKVIGNLIDTLKKQDYPKEYFDIFLTADNCTDSTAEVARAQGVTVYERHDTEHIGKGYVLDLMLKSIWRDRGEDTYDAYIVFDADNLIESNYLTEINKTFSLGYDVVSSYRNSTNYGEGWRAAGAGMWWLRDARVLNNARMKLGSNTFVAGTGFLFSNALAKKRGGWPYHTLTEDFEFSVNNAFQGIKTGYCESAKFYDWQSTGLRQSWRQKLRWTKGGFQVFVKYRKEFIRGLFSKRFASCFDMTMCFFGAMFVSMLAILVNIAAFVAVISVGGGILDFLLRILPLIPGAYFGLYFFGAIITASEWKLLRASAFKKILYTFTFPLYVASFLPVAIVALFSKNVGWKPINHEATDANIVSTESTKV